MLIDPVYAYILSFLTLLIIISKYRNHITLAIVIATLMYGTLVFNPIELIYSFIKGLINLTTIRLLLAIIIALYLAGLLGEVGLLEKLTEGSKSLGYRASAATIPALVGLIPMPGGALVSAVMVDELYFNDMHISKEGGSFINYWFRHIWVPSWPLYQSALLAAAILHISIFQLLSITYPATIAGIITGIIFIAIITRHAGGRSEGKIKQLILNLWPFILVFIFGLIIKLEIILTLLIVTIIVILYFRPNKEIHLKSLKFALDPKILIIMIFAMIYREFIVDSGAATRIYHILSENNINKYLVAYIVPFLVGTATSNEFMYAALAFPLLINIFIPQPNIIDTKALLLGFTGGWLGVMLSPIHLCLAFTLDHFKADFLKTYKIIMLGILITTFLIWIYISLF